MPELVELNSVASAVRLGIAGLVGLAVGIEREWSQVRRIRRFAGIRTFLLFGLLGGASGLFADAGYESAGVALLAVGGLFGVAAYWTAARRPARPLDGTTEVAVLVVLALAFVAGAGGLGLAGGAAIVVVFALAEKQWLHHFVAGLDRTEIRATLQFGTLAAVILPLLPAGPYDAFWGIRPRALWGVVVLFSGLNFLGYLARRIIGTERGYGVAGLLGGTVSSTAVTLQFSRLSRSEPGQAGALALGVVAACAVLPLRVLVVSFALNAVVGMALLPYLAPVALAGILMVGLAWRQPVTHAPEMPDASNPLRLGSAIQMAALFELAIIVTAVAHARWGSTGVLGSAVMLGFADVDALTVSLTRMSGGAEVAGLAARAIALGVLVNTAFKVGVALVIGAPSFRRKAAAGIGVFGAVLGASMALISLL